MTLKPDPIQAALVDELIEGALHGNNYDEAEEEWLREFRSDLSRHRR